MKCDGCGQDKPDDEITTEHGVSVCDVCSRKHASNLSKAARGVDEYLATLARLEPDIHPVDASAFYASAAISLKRLADKFCGVPATESDARYFIRMITKLAVTDNAADNRELLVSLQARANELLGTP